MNLIQERPLNMQSKCCGWLIALCLLLGAGIMARAQNSSTGEIRGTVTDPTGAAGLVEGRAGKWVCTVVPVPVKAMQNRFRPLRPLAV